jgi:hypothetical protein
MQGWRPRGPDPFTLAPDGLVTLHSTSPSRKYRHTVGWQLDASTLDREIEPAISRSRSIHTHSSAANGTRARLLSPMLGEQRRRLSPWTCIRYRSHARPLDPGGRVRVRELIGYSWRPPSGDAPGVPAAEAPPHQRHFRLRQGSTAFHPYPPWQR